MTEKPTEGMEAWLHRRAAKLGVSLEELRRLDLEAVANADYPTAECLDLWTVSEIARNPLHPVPEHARTCAMCATLIAVERQMTRGSM